MLKKIWKKLNTRYYRISEENIRGAFEEFEREIRKEIKAEYEEKFNNIKEKINEKNITICKLEKKETNLLIKLEMLQASHNILEEKCQMLIKENKKSMKKNKYEEKEVEKLAEEIFA